MYRKQKKSGKTIFILINRSFITRNILRSGTLELLKKAGHDVIVFFEANEIPEYVRQEFEDEQVTLHALRIKKRGRVHRYFNRLKRYLIITNNIKLLIRYYGPRREHRIEGGIISKTSKPKWRVRIEFAALYILSNIPFLKSLFRFIEHTAFPEHNEKVKEAFATHKPDLIFSTATGGTFEYPFLKEARRHGVPTMGMSKSWDNITNEFNPVIPDYFIAQNETIQRRAVNTQRIPKENVFLVGMPHFDWYSRKDILLSKEKHFKNKRLDPKRALIFFGLEGVWAPNDHLIAEKIHEWIVEDKLALPCQLLIRAHFSSIGTAALEAFRDKKHTIVDDYRMVDFMIDKWDPSVSEAIDFTNSVAHASVVISMASSLNLDAACAGTPAITLGFGSEYIDGRDVTTEKWYSTDHMKMFMEPGGVAKADSYPELKNMINKYLTDTNFHNEERERMKSMLCYKVDGKASERLVAVIGKVLDK